jgi:hypothetical protein
LAKVLMLIAGHQQHNSREPHLGWQKFRNQASWINGIKRSTAMRPRFVELREHLGLIGDLLEGTHLCVRNAKSAGGLAATERGHM